MLRSVCLFIIIGLGVQPPANAQNTQPVEPKRFQISDSSPLATLSSKSNSISPAAFLQANQEKNKQPIPRKSEEKIPSILTGKRSVKRSSIVQTISDKQDEIDPLNIPSSPIKPRKTNSLPPSNSGFQPRPSNFQPPKTTQFQSAQPIGKPAGNSKPASNGFQVPSNNRVPANTKAPTSTNPKSSASSSANKSQPIQTQAPRTQTQSPRIQTPRIQPPPTSYNPTARPTGSQTKTSPSNVRPSNTQPSSAVPNRTTQTLPTTNFNPTRTADRSPGIPRSNPVTSNPLTSMPDNSIPRNATAVESNVFSAQQSSPQIKVVSSGPKSISVNKTAQFQVKVVNVGQINANDVMVGIEIPDWVEVVTKPMTSGGEAVVKELGDGRGIVWNLSYLPAGRNALITLNLEPKANRAFNLKTEWTTAPVSSEAKVLVTQAKLATRISGPTEVKYGQKAVYTITIENTGNGDAEKVNVSLSQNLGGDSASVGLIEAGASKQFEVELTAGQAGPMKLEASVKGDAGVSSAIAKEIVVRRAKLVVKATGPKFKYAGSALTYNIAVENQGDAPAKNITAAALLPLNAEYISGLNQITENDGRKIGWKISEIPAGSKRDFIITCLVNQAGQAKMEVGVRSGDGFTSGGVVNTKIEALADLKLEVVDPRGPQAVGRQVVYELHIKNRGTKAARNVQISGEFSDFIDPVGGTGAKASIAKGGIINFTPIEEIKVGESVVVKVLAKASQAGTHTFRAIVECKEQDIRKISEGTTKFFGESASKD